MPLRVLVSAPGADGAVTSRSPFAGSATPGFRPARPEPMSAASAPLSSGRWASLTVPLDDARHVAIRSTEAGSRCARDGVTAVTGTVTGSGRAFEAIEDLGRSLTDAERALRKALRKPILLD